MEALNVTWPNNNDTSKKGSVLHMFQKMLLLPEPSAAT
jgi:hypothetical protein